MGFGVLRSRPEVRSCGGEGSCGVTWEYVVFAGSVRSGLLTLRDMDRDLDRSTVTIKGKKTGLNRPRPQFSVHGPVLTSPGLNWFKTGLDRFFANY